MCNSKRGMLWLIAGALLVAAASAVSPVRGTRCTKNQVINRLTVYEDGALEAECGPIPCGVSAMRCIEDQTSCRADTDVFSGMRWAANGQSVLLRCCTLKVANKIYVGTDLVSAGSYYVGGPVAEADLYGQGGEEYDFIANVRTEQGGVRVWVYRIMCPKGEEAAPAEVGDIEDDDEEEEEEQTEAPKSRFEKRREYLLNRLGAKAQVSMSNDEEPESLTDEDEEPSNPLQYRPNRFRKH